MSHTFDVMYTGATRGSLCSSPPTPPHFINPASNGAERSLLECNRPGQGTTCPRLSCTGNSNIRVYGAVTCIKGEFITILYVLHSCTDKIASLEP